MTGMPGMAAGLYLHVPFCERACPYCDFDFVPGRRPQTGAYFAALEQEWQQRQQELSRVAPDGFDTVYVGGGTPSQLGRSGLRTLAGMIARYVGGKALAEYTVECNPEHIDAGLLDALVEVGVGRISLGVQSFSASGLSELGRVHAAEQARASVEMTLARGLDLSVDLIVGWPGHDEAKLRADLSYLAETGVGHLSLYALTIEAQSAWPKLVRRGIRQEPDSDRQGELLELAAQTLVRHGYEHYEIASYARPGRHALHNRKYWTWQNYVGMGPSAASAVYLNDGQVERRSNPRGLENWVKTPGEAANLERLEPEAAAAEGLWLGLRQLSGLSLTAFEARFARDEAWIRRRLGRSLAQGNVEIHADKVRVAPDRWLWHDAVAAEVLAD